MILENSPTPDISASETWIIQDGQQIENLLGGKPDDIRYFISASPGVTIFSNDDLMIEGGIHYNPAIGDTIMMLFDGDSWYELSRSLNPLYNGITITDYQMDNAYIERQIELLRAAVASNMDYYLQNFNDLQNQLDELNFGGSVNAPTTLSYDTNTIVNIQSDIDGLGKYLGYDVIIEFDAGVYNIISRINFDGFYGPKKIYVFGPTSQQIYTPTKNCILDCVSSGLTEGAFEFEQCNCGIVMDGFQINHNNTLTNLHSGAINLISCADVDLQNLAVNSSNYIGNGVHAYKSELTVTNTYFQKGETAIFANERSRVIVDNCDDFSYAPKYGLYATRGSYIGVVDNQFPDGTIEDVRQDRGAMVVV